MAKVSMVQREHKRTKTVAKFAVKRAELKRYKSMLKLATKSVGKRSRSYKIAA